MIASAQMTTEPVIENGSEADTGAVGNARTTADAASTEEDTSGQADSPDGPVSNTAIEVEIQRRINELRREQMDDRADTVDWWLAALAVVLGFFGIVVVVGGYIGFMRFREIEVEAKNSVEKVKSSVKTAENLVKEIEKKRDKSQEILQTLTAEAAADDPGEAKRAVKDVRENPEASLTDKAIADAVSLQQQGRRKDAIEKWRAVAHIAEGSDDDLASRAWFSIGYLIRTESLEDCILAYDEAIRLKPDHAVAYYNRGNAKAALGQHEDAVVDYDEAIHLKPDHAEVRYNRGNAKAALGQHEGAVVDYGEAIRLKPDYAEAYNNRGSAKAELGQHEDAIVDYDEAIRLKPDHVAYNNRGSAKAALGLKDEARKDFETALDLTRNTNNADLVAKVEQLLRDLDATEDS